VFILGEMWAPPVNDGRNPSVRVEGRKVGRGGTTEVGNELGVQQMWGSQLGVGI